MTIQFTIPGVPVGKGRPRISTRGGFARAYTPEKTANYENLVKLAGSTAMDGRPPMTCAVSIELRLFVAPPASWSKKKTAEALAGEILPTTKPDADNVLKAIADALNEIVWKDDKQMTDVLIRKRYSIHPSAHVIVKPCGVAA